jgi:chromate transporter
LLEEEDMLNMAAVAQSSPGAIAVNASILVGWRLMGITGAMISILGTVLPPLIILSVISLFYAAFRSNAVVSAVLKGMLSGVCAVIFDVVITMEVKK